MAMKRKMMTPLVSSLYDDLDVGSATTGKAENSTDSSTNMDSGGGMQKKRRDEGSTAEELERGEGDGAGRWTIASFCCKARL